MIIERIREAKAATEVVRDTRSAIRNTVGLRSGEPRLGIRTGGYSDSVAEAVRLRERLREKLARQEATAAEYQARMMEALSKIPSTVTQKIFLCRYYDGCKWNVVAQRVGLGVQATKMRHQRYLEQEQAGHVA